MCVMDLIVFVQMRMTLRRRNIPRVPHAGTKGTEPFPMMSASKSKDARFAKKNRRPLDKINHENQVALAIHPALMKNS